MRAWQLVRKRTDTRFRYRVVFFRGAATQPLGLVRYRFPFTHSAPTPLTARPQLAKGYRLTVCCPSGIVAAFSARRNDSTETRPLGSIFVAVS